jgi:hypothetical protein
LGQSRSPQRAPTKATRIVLVTNFGTIECTNKKTPQSWGINPKKRRFLFRYLTLFL